MNTLRKEPYRIVLHDAGLLFIQHWQYGRQIWTLSTRNLSAKYHERPCAKCGVRLGAAKAYHPITNGNNRMHRICVKCGGGA